MQRFVPLSYWSAKLSPLQYDGTRTTMAQSSLDAFDDGQGWRAPEHQVPRPWRRRQLGNGGAGDMVAWDWRRVARAPTVPCLRSDTRQTRSPMVGLVFPPSFGKAQNAHMAGADDRRIRAMRG